MTEKDNDQPKAIKDKDIDLVVLASTIWLARKFIFKVIGLSIVLGLVISFSIPKEYTTSVTMIPEVGSKSGAGNLSALASVAGINLAGGSSEDGLSPELYPDIVLSTPFILDLFPVRLKTIDGDKTISLYEYMDNCQKESWWNTILLFPFKAIKKVFSSEPNSVNDLKFDSFKLTSNQTEILNLVGKRIAVNVDNKSGIINLSVTMQDPFVSASLTDTVMQNLQAYIIDYRTMKAKKDLAYTEKLYIEAQKEYYDAQQKYASFADSNLDIVLVSYKSRLERLQNEATLAYNLYNQISQQLQLAKAKVQEVTPVYTVIQPASIALKPSKPNKPFILVAFIFLALVGSVGWVLLKK